MREVRRAIERIDIPAILAALIAEPLLFAENVVRRPLLRDAFADQDFSAARSAAVTRSASPLYSIFKCWWK